MSITITITDDELPEAVTALDGKETTAKDLAEAYGDQFPGISGLKKGIGEERDNVKKLRGKFREIRETLGADEHADPVELVKSLSDTAAVHQERESLLRERNQERAENLMTKAIMKAQGNVLALMPHLKDRIRQEDDGSLTPLASDGQPLQIDGEPADLDGLLGLLSKEPHLKSLFAGTSHSGSGGFPTGKGTARDVTVTGDAPARTTRISEMTTAQKVAAVKAHGSLEGYPA